jgi:hypothetical protein
MAEVTVKVDATRALAKFDRVPIQVRNELRGIIPDLTKQLGGLVNSKLDTELKSRKRIKVTEELHDSPRRITGVVAAVWTGGDLGRLVPSYLEFGTRPHEIEANVAGALAFFWERVGANVFFKRVMHPGFAGIHYMERSFGEMKSEIVSKIKSAAQIGARRA